MPVIYAAEAPTFEASGFRCTGYTAPSRGAEELCTWRIQADPGARSEAHWLDHEEIFILLDGALFFSIAGEEVELQAGDALSIPARSLLQVTNREAEPAMAIACLPVGAQATAADGHVIGTPPWTR